MKIYLAGLFFIFCSMPATLFAQSKAGHVNTQAILESMTGARAAMAKIDSLTKGYQDQLQELYVEYQKLLAKESKEKLPDPMVQDYNTRKRQLEERIQAFQEDAKKDIANKTEELMIPIRKKISVAIKEVALEGKYSIVIDSSQQGFVLYANETDDLTEAVKKKLGKN